jgi:hypothetical protein
VGEPQTPAFYIVGQKSASGPLSISNQKRPKKGERLIHGPVAENWEFFGPCGNSNMAPDSVNRAAIEGLTAEGMSA